MKILFLSKDFSFNGGGERMLCNLANELASNHEITVISFDKSDREILFVLKENIKFIKADIQSRKINFFTKFDYIAYLRNNKTELNGFDVVVGVGIVCNLILAAISSKISATCIAWEHCSYRGIPFWQQMLRRILFPKVNKVVCLTYEDLPRYKKINPNSSVIYNFTCMTFRVAPMLENKRFIYVGRLSHLKGFDYLLNCMGEFIKRNIEWSFEIIGDGEYADKLNAFMKLPEAKNRIRYIKSSSEVQKELEQSSCMIMMSRHEGLPMVLIEAQVCGLPVISFDTETGPNEIIVDNKSGFLIQKNDEEKFIEKMLRIANEEELLESFSGEAILQSKKFSKDAIIPQWEDLLSNC